MAFPHLDLSDGSAESASYSWASRSARVIWSGPRHNAAVLDGPASFRRAYPLRPIEELDEVRAS